MFEYSETVADLVCGNSAWHSNDCNENSVPDECDIADGTSEDCNDNGVPDECDIADGTSKDCNENSVPDECDIADGTSEDCQPDGIPDECQLAGEVPILIVILTDFYGHETTWQLWKQGGDLVASGGPYEDATLYEHSIAVDSAYCYDFTIFDSYGDGICCDYGEGVL